MAAGHEELERGTQRNKIGPKPSFALTSDAAKQQSKAVILQRAICAMFTLVWFESFGEAGQ